MILLAFCASGFAQKAQVFGGYQYLHLGGSGGGSGTNVPGGWDTNITGLFSKNFGITGDFSGSYKNGGHVYTYTFGPTVRTAVGKNAAVAAHALFGGATVGGNGASSTSAFATALGGALDVNLTKKVAFRVGQLDYVMTRFSSTNQNNFRYSTGLVFTF